MTPDLEIIIPAQENSGAAPAKTAASLAAQTDRDFGVILSGDFSGAGRDPLAEAREQLAAAGIAVRRVTPPRGLERVEHWNWAHAQAQAAWLKPLLPGERLAPEYVARLRQCRRENPRAAVVRCDAEAATEWGPQIERAPFTGRSLRPAEFVGHISGALNWLSHSGGIACSRTAWLAAGGFSPHFPARAALHLNVILALHHGLENLPERLAFVNSPDAAPLNAGNRRGVNVWLELWLILRQAKNYCLAAKLPWTKKWLLPRAVLAAGRLG